MRQLPPLERHNACHYGGQKRVLGRHKYAPQPCVQPAHRLWRFVLRQEQTRLLRQYE